MTWTNADKVLFPETGFTKGELLAYYDAVAPLLLPHLEGRAVTMARFPDGVAAPGWFQMNCRGHPPWMRTTEIIGRRGQRLRYCLVEDRDALLWMINLGTIELHPFLACAGDPDVPRDVVFDLDPGPDAGALASARVALWVRDALDARGHRSRVKTSGKKGLHVYAPLDGRWHYADSRAFARAVAGELAAAHPELITDRIAKSERHGRVLIDWRQNAIGLSTVAPYSVRALPWPLVSTPLAWGEVEAAIAGGRAAALAFSPRDVLPRVARFGDLFTIAAPVQPNV
ncbi:MAG: non-homologous end-joining DNA ligase [Myxococcales bacterium]|nr:non-homologous end-joining DNA ligase [Myxococcales bacterium]